METEKKMQAKKEWTKPELIVLVRSKPEEAVLGLCKWHDSNGPAAEKDRCKSKACYPGCSESGNS